MQMFVIQVMNFSNFLYNLLNIVLNYQKKVKVNKIKLFFQLNNRNTIN